MTEHKMTNQDKIDMFFNNTNKRASFNLKDRRQKLVDDFLDTNYFSSSTQELIFKRMLKEIHSVMKKQDHISVSGSTFYAYEQLITGIQDLFTEGWQMVRYFKYYAGTSELNSASQTDILNVVINISKRDRSKFERLQLLYSVQEEQENAA